MHSRAEVSDRSRLAGERGFTLIEILCVLGVVAVLSAIAIPRYAEARERALVAVMQADLNELRLAEEAYRTSESHGAYAGTIDLLEDRFVPSDGVSVTITEADRDRWAATAEHAVASHVCAYSSERGVIACSGSASEASEAAGGGGGADGWEVEGA